MCQKDTFAYYLSYATWFSFVAFVGVELFQQEMRLFVLKILFFHKTP